MSYVAVPILDVSHCSNHFIFLTEGLYLAIVRVFHIPQVLLTFC